MCKIFNENNIKFDNAMNALTQQIVINVTTIYHQTKSLVLITVLLKILIVLYSFFLYKISHI